MQVRVRRGHALFDVSSSPARSSPDVELLLHKVHRVERRPAVELALRVLPLMELDTALHASDAILLLLLAVPLLGLQPPRP